MDECTLHAPKHIHGLHNIVCWL